MRVVVLFLGVLFLCLPMATAATTTYYYAGSFALASKEAGEISYSHPDSLGSDTETRSLPFGQAIVESSRLGYTGKEQDKSNLHFFGARYYDGDLGRFTGIDPDPREPVYQFVRNNPVRFIDATGRGAAEKWQVVEEGARWTPVIVEGGKAAVRAPATGGLIAGSGAVLAGFFLTSGSTQAALSGNNIMHDPNNLYTDPVEAAWNDFVANDMNKEYHFAGENMMHRDFVESIDAYFATTWAPHSDRVMRISNLMLKDYFMPLLDPSYVHDASGKHGKNKFLFMAVDDFREYMVSIGEFKYIKKRLVPVYQAIHSQYQTHHLGGNIESFPTLMRRAMVIEHIVDWVDAYRVRTNQGSIMGLDETVAKYKESPYYETACRLCDDPRAGISGDIFVEDVLVNLQKYDSEWTGK